MKGNAAATINNIAAHELLFRFGILAELIGGVILVFLVMPAVIYFVNVVNDLGALMIVRGADFLNLGRRRWIAPGLLVHESVEQRFADAALQYKPSNLPIVEVRGRPTRIIVRNRAKVMRKDHPCDPSRSTRNSELGRKKKYSAPQFARLSTEEARGMLTARGLPDSPVVRQTLGMGSGTGEAACQEMTGLASVGTE